MALYFKDVEITNIDNLVPQTGLDITDIWFGSTNVYTMWAVYEGTLPATINANGDDVRQYQVWGNVGGVGEPTKNLFSSVWEQGSIDTSGQNEESSARIRTEGYIEVIPNKIYSLSRSIYSGFMNVRFYSSDKSFISVGSTSNIRLIDGWSVANPMGNGVPFCCFEIIDTNVKYMRIADQSNKLATKYMMVEGEYTRQTMPRYEPYGYKLDMSVSDGTNTSTTPIYIGSDPLWKVGSYADIVDYKRQKIVRAINKTVLTGGETYPFLKNLPSSTSNYLYYARRPDILPGGRNAEVFCSHLPYRNVAPQNVIGINSQNDYNVVYLNFGSKIMNSQPSGNTVKGLKEYLSAQYAAGTPVTIWYILETAIETNPPVPLPALPTCEGATIVDYAGSGTAPEKVLLKYRKEGY